MQALHHKRAESIRPAGAGPPAAHTHTRPPVDVSSHRLQDLANDTDVERSMSMQAASTAARAEHPADRSVASASLSRSGSAAGRPPRCDLNPKAPSRSAPLHDLDAPDRYRARGHDRLVDDAGKLDASVGELLRPRGGRPQALLSTFRVANCLHAGAFRSPCRSAGTIASRISHSNSGSIMCLTKLHSAVIAARRDAEARSDKYPHSLLITCKRTEYEPIIRRLDGVAASRAW
jgi:hypothetical protein